MWSFLHTPGSEDQASSSLADWFAEMSLALVRIHQTSKDGWPSLSLHVGFQ